MRVTVLCAMSVRMGSKLLRRPGGAVGLAAATLVLTLAGLISCVVNPATGQKEFVPFMPSREQQVNLGLQAAPQFMQQGGGRLENPIIQNYVSAVGARIAGVVPKDQAAGFKFSYTVLNDKAINAFALPGGPVFITKAILFKMNNEAELAFVLGHETGHVVAQHVGRQMSKATELQLLLAGVDVAAGGQDAGAGAQLATQLGQFAGQMYLLKFSRDEESQSDTLGTRYMVAAGYSPAGAVQAMEMLQREGGSGKNDWFSTHPSPENRVGRLQSQIGREFPQTVNNPAYRLAPEPFQQNVLQQRAAGRSLEDAVLTALYERWSMR